jgi:SAM-dependent methyltransferase
VPFGDNSFDFVLAEGDPISYCSDPDLAVKELDRVLKPGHYLSAGVDSYYYTLSGMLNRPEIDFHKFEKVRREKRFFANDCGFGFWLFTPEDLLKLFKKHGFKVIKIVGKPVLFRNRPETAPLLKDPERAQKLIDIELRFCEVASIVGNSGHLHIVAQKK